MCFLPQSVHFATQICVSVEDGTRGEHDEFRHKNMCETYQIIEKTEKILNKGKYTSKYHFTKIPKVQ